MSTTGDRQTIDIDLAEDLGKEAPPEEPIRATVEIAYGSDGGRPISISYGEEEWLLEFNDEGKCVDRDPPARPLPNWMTDAMELVRGEL
ncbi:hypothetical protein [Natrinema gari]|uniref:Uncharacterized protein n=1 Tax=Natrinema gari JCM 14663 TaxID=1230459 RepID=L9ZCY3_9EURY|nr:hypothetical protein [Natrinema gari]ELY83452.1 hypothetical protein C486_02283 [Natrinema gari JCM 14663]